MHRPPGAARRHSSSARLGHPHVFSDIIAVTLGAVRELPFIPGRIGISADITMYGMPDDLQPFVGGSKSFHALRRWRRGGAAPAHVH